MFFLFLNGRPFNTPFRPNATAIEKKTFFVAPLSTLPFLVLFFDVIPTIQRFVLIMLLLISDSRERGQGRGKRFHSGGGAIYVFLD